MEAEKEKIKLTLDVSSCKPLREIVFEMCIRDSLRVYARTIKRLRDALIRTLVAERARYPVASDSGDIDAAKVWRVGRTPCSRIFRRFESNDKGGYVVDLLLDGSTSQKGREALVAIQAYIIARALIEAGIPCRVNGFNCFLDFTVLKRCLLYTSLITVLVC